MKYIANNYPDIYKIITIKKIIQAIGRSVRNKDDHAITFVLDCNIEYLFSSQLNVWKNEFKII
jgi:Rad3-related DNA helicase